MIIKTPPGRRPSFQFYPADFISDPRVAAMSAGAVGVWMDVICYLHFGDPYGALQYPLRQIAHMVKAPIELVTEAVSVGLLRGCDEKGHFAGVTFTPHHAGRHGETITILEPCHGPIWVNNRMVRDEYKRQVRASFGALGGEHGFKKGQNKMPPRGDSGASQLAV